jgi:hypothetical protein
MVSKQAAESTDTYDFSLFFPCHHLPTTPLQSVDIVVNKKMKNPQCGWTVTGYFPTLTLL